MAQYEQYKIKDGAGEVSVLKAISEYRDNDGNFIQYKHKSVVRYEGEVVDASEISPVVLNLLEEGDERVNSYLEPVGDSSEKAAEEEKKAEEEAQAKAEEEAKAAAEAEEQAKLEAEKKAEAKAEAGETAKVEEKPKRRGRPKKQES